MFFIDNDQSQIGKRGEQRRSGSHHHLHLATFRSFELEEEERQLCIHTIVSAQNPGLNPALLAVAAEKELPQYVPDFSLVRRTDVLDAEGKPFR